MGGLEVQIFVFGSNNEFEILKIKAQKSDFGKYVPLGDSILLLPYFDPDLPRGDGGSRGPNVAS